MTNSLLLYSDQILYKLNLSKLANYTKIVAIFIVLRACGLVQYFKQAKQLFWKAHNKNASVLFDKYTNMKKSPFSLEAIVYIYCNT